MNKKTYYRPKQCNFNMPSGPLTPLIACGRWASSKHPKKKLKKTNKKNQWKKEKKIENKKHTWAQTMSGIIWAFCYMSPPLFISPIMFMVQVVVVCGECLGVVGVVADWQWSQVVTCSSSHAWLMMFNFLLI